MTPPYALLACPQCGRGGSIGPEETEGRAHLRCAACAARYPVVSSIPFLHREAEAHIAGWRQRLHDFIAGSEETRHLVLAQLAGDAVVAPTRRRLQALHEVMGLHRDRLVALMRDAGITPEPRTVPDRAAVPSEGRLTSYYHQIHRDWGWDADNDEARDASDTVMRVLDAAGAGDLGTTLVLGAGACRMSYDLRGRARQIIALDLNPLPFLVAQRLFRGETVSLYELPNRPRDSHTVFADRALRAEPTDRLWLLFADGLTPPFADHSLDTVVTPWFIDQIPRDGATLIPEIHRVLRPGGRWLNFGPAVYHPAHTLLVHRYCFDELLALAEAHGFAIAAHERRRMRYMESPIDAQGRTEEVLTFCAVAGERRAEAEPAPAWLNDPDAAIPRFAGLDDYRAPHPMFAEVAQRIDGHKTARQIADELSRTRGLPADAATPAVLACVAEIYKSVS